jgi:thioredoxin 1
MNEILSITEPAFEETVLQSQQPVLIEFGATWCGPCKSLEPILHEIAKTLNGKLKVVKIDVDESMNLAMQFQVMSVPTMVLMVNGQEVERMIGLQAREKLVEKIEDHLG